MDNERVFVKVFIVMYTREERVDFVLDTIERSGARIIAIDGKCASGKTTLQGDLASRISFSLVSMDDFFLPPELREPQRMKEKGGNVHYERFIEEVVKPLEEGRKSFSYRKFSCSSMSYTGLVEVKNDNLVIVEGSYALHPAFPPYWDVSLLLTVSDEEQIKRLKVRSSEKLDDFISRWIPMENDYFSSCNILERATYVL